MDDSSHGAESCGKFAQSTAPKMNQFHVFSNLDHSALLSLSLCHVLTPHQGMAGSLKTGSPTESISNEKEVVS